MICLTAGVDQEIQQEQEGVLQHPDQSLLLCHWNSVWRWYNHLLRHRPKSQHGRPYPGVVWQNRAFKGSTHIQVLFLLQGNILKSLLVFFVLFLFFFLMHYIRYRYLPQITDIWMICHPGWRVVTPLKKNCLRMALRTWLEKWLLRVLTIPWLFSHK